MYVRYCAGCGAEYRPEIELCADCGVPLQDRFTGITTVEPPELGEVFPPGDLTTIFSGQAAEVEPMARRLSEAGLRFRLDADLTGFRLLVRQEDHDAVVRQLAGLMEAAAGAVPRDALDRDFDPLIGYARCPACSTTLVRGAAECPECRLAVGGNLPTCPSCHAEIGAGDVLCRVCGRDFGGPR